MDGHEQLSSLIVDRVSDPFYLFLQRFVNLPQGFHGVLKSPLCHLVGRHAFGKKIGARSKQVFLEFLVVGTLEELSHRLVVKGDQLKETLAFLDGATTKYISSALNCFASACHIFAEQ